MIACQPNGDRMPADEMLAGSIVNDRESAFQLPYAELPVPVISSKSTKVPRYSGAARLWSTEAQKFQFWEEWFNCTYFENSIVSGYYTNGVENVRVSC